MFSFVTREHRPITSLYHVFLPLNLSFVLLNDSVVSQLCGMGPTNRKWRHATGSRSTMLSLAHWRPRHAASVEVLFSTKVQLYQIWIYFYSKVQHIPSASDYIKTYNVHTVDISALPFTVSGLNRHYFSGFSSLQQIIKLKKVSKKENDKCLHMTTKDMNTVSDVFLW